MNKLCWELRQLAGRFRDDARQLEDILYYHPNLVAPLDLIKIMVAYWSEDPRCLDLLLGIARIDSTTHHNFSDHGPNEDHDIEIYTSLCHAVNDRSLYEGVFTTQIVIRIEMTRFCAETRAISWNSCNALNALFILPEINLSGREVEFHYPAYTLAAIAGLRDELYTRVRRSL